MQRYSCATCSIQLPFVSQQQAEPYTEPLCLVPYHEKIACHKMQPDACDARSIAAQLLSAYIPNTPSSHLVVAFNRLPGALSPSALVASQLVPGLHQQAALSPELQHNAIWWLE